MKITSISGILGLCFMAGCSLFNSTDYPPLDVVPQVDLNRYLGLWYEIASLPVSQQEGCSCTTAEYALGEVGEIRVVNSCVKEGNGAERTTAEGKAFVVPNSNNAKLKVQFFWPFRGDYWIIALDENYGYAVVGTPNRKYFWILSRTPTMEQGLLEELLSMVRAKGFDTGRAQRTLQNCGENKPG